MQRGEWPAIVLVVTTLVGGVLAAVAFVLSSATVAALVLAIVALVALFIAAALRSRHQ